jgi:HAD superfamily hydrolase (TIGR01549 family)
MALKAVVFDMDGVLVDSVHAWWLTFNQALVHFGFPTVSKEKFVCEILGESTEDDVEKYYKGVGVEELLSAYDRFFRQNIKSVRAFADTRPLLEFLSGAGVKSAVATNTPRELARATLGHTGILDRFDVVLTSDDVSRGKPDPEMILKACKLLRASVSEIIYVGDTVSDLKAARAAGVRMVGVGIKADETVSRLGELRSLVEAALRGN